MNTTTPNPNPTSIEEIRAEFESLRQLSDEQGKLFWSHYDRIASALGCVSYPKPSTRRFATCVTLLKKLPNGTNDAASVLMHWDCSNEYEAIGLAVVQAKEKNPQHMVLMAQATDVSEVK